MRGLAPVEKGNLSERVYQNIRSALMEGRFQPGDRLRISEMATELDVSITPVREAIFRLVSDHVLEMKAATAIHVPELSPKSLDEIQRIRICLEGEGAALAAERITPAELRKLEKIQADFSKAAAIDPREAAYQNRLFHFRLLAAARAPLIFATVENMWVLMGPLLRRFHIEMPRRELGSREHKHFEVLDALAVRDAERTKRAIQADIAWGRVMIDWLERKSDPRADP